MKNWLNYFKSNRIQRQDIPSDHEINIEPNLRGPLIRSLQRFQVGESGEGHHLRRQAAKSGDADYQAAIDLFIKEEQEHARLMACVLRKLNAPLIEHHWSDACFILLRRLFGLHHELLVLLMPEMIAKRYFRALGHFELRANTRDHKDWTGVEGRTQFEGIPAISLATDFSNCF